MSNLIARQDDRVEILSRDRALRVAKKLVTILRDECNQRETRLHTAQASVAAGLKCRSVHGMTETNFPRRWNRDEAADALVEHGAVPDRALARLAVKLLEDRHIYDLVDWHIHESSLAH
jgi:hypothetical protein